MLLHMAASTKGGSLSTVRLLLAMGADPNACDFGHVPYDRFCETPLKCAIYCGSPEVMQALVDGGADVNLNGFGHPPLTYLVQRDKGTAVHKDRLAVLLACPDLDLQKPSTGCWGQVGQRPAYTALTWRNGRGYTDIHDTLVIEARRRKRWSPARAAWVTCVVRGGWALRGAPVRVQPAPEPLLDAKALLAAAAGPNAPWATISAALASGVRVVVRSRDVKDKRGNTLLHFAVSAPEGWPVAQAALAQGAHPDAPNAVGSTPLMNAVAAGMVQAVRGLIAAGASVNAVSSIGMSPVHALRGAPEGTDLACLSALLVRPDLEMDLPLDPCYAFGVDTLTKWATKWRRHALATMVQEEVMRCVFRHFHRFGAFFSRFHMAQLPFWSTGARASRSG